MQKILAEFKDCYILEDVLVDNMSFESAGFNLHNSSTPKTLTACVNYFSQLLKFSSIMLLNSELPDKQSLFIAKELAKAIDKNSVSDIRYLKNKYGHSKEFAIAKDFLNAKCKQVWNVFETKSNKLFLPKEAMKALGVTNCPSLEYLLKDSLLFYEKDNGSTTVDIIESILRNKNMNYTFDEVYRFIRTFVQKEHIDLNQKTIEFLIIQTNCSLSKMKDLNIDYGNIYSNLKNLSYFVRIKFALKVLVAQYFKK